MLLIPPHADSHILPPHMHTETHIHVNTPTFVLYLQDITTVPNAVCVCGAVCTVYSAVLSSKRGELCCITT